MLLLRCAGPFRFIKRIAILIWSVYICCHRPFSRLLWLSWKQILCTIYLFTCLVLEYTKQWIWRAAGKHYQYAHVALKEDICASSFSPNRKIESKLGQPQPAVRTNGSDGLFSSRLWFTCLRNLVDMSMRSLSDMYAPVTDKLCCNLLLTWATDQALPPTHI